MLDMNGDTERLAGKLRSIETTVRMIKERKDKKKYTDQKFHKILELLAESDGFSKEEIEMLIVANRLSGSIAHGNYSELMDKIDKHFLKQYFPEVQLSRNVVSKTKIDPDSSGEEVLNAIISGEREPATGDSQSDIFEAYIVAKTGGYLRVLEIYTNEVRKILDSKFPSELSS